MVNNINFIINYAFYYKKMRLLKLLKTISLEAIKQNVKSAKTNADFRRWQIIYFVSAY